MLTRSAITRAGFVLLLAIIAIAIAQYQPTRNVGTVWASQGELATFVDKPADATEIYPGSGIYQRAAISPEIVAAITAQSQEDWEKYHIAKESNLGLPLGSVFLQAKSGKYVELALYERAAFTVFNGKPARQILSTIIFEGKVQVTEDEFITVPSYLRSTFAALPVAGEGAQYTPSTGAVAKLLSTDKAKAADAGWSRADQLFRWDGSFTAPDSSLKIEPLSLGQPDATTGHRVPDVISAGLAKLFGEKVVENAGLPLSPAVWILAQVKGAETPVCVQVFQRAIVTYNPANDEANRVQVGLGGGIVQGGLTVASAPTATPVPPTTTPPPTATTKPAVDINTAHGRIIIENRSTMQIQSTNNTILASLFDKTYQLTGKTGNRDTHYVILPFGKDLSSRKGSSPEQGRYDGRGVVYASVSRINQPYTASRLSYATLRGSDGIVYFQIDPDDLKVWELALSGDYYLEGTNGERLNYRYDTWVMFLGGLLSLYGGTEYDTAPYVLIRNQVLIDPNFLVYLACTPCDWGRFPLQIALSK